MPRQYRYALIDFITLVVAVGGFFLGVHFLPAFAWSQPIKDHANHVVSVAGFLGAASMAWVQLERGRRASRVEYDHRLRVDFITGPTHEQFQSVIAILEAPRSVEGISLARELAARSADKPSAAVEAVLEPKLVRDFDALVNYLEAVAALHRDGILDKDDLRRGLWSYYIKVLTYSPHVHQYVTLDRHEWTGLQTVLKKLLKRRPELRDDWCALAALVAAKDGSSC